MIYTVRRMDAHLKELFGLFQQQFGSTAGQGAGSGSSLMKIEGISGAFIKAIFRAAAALHRSNPWNRYRSTHMFGIKVGKDSDWHGGKQVFSCFQFVGGAGNGDLGFNAFRSEEDANANGGSSKQIKFVPQNGFLRVVFRSEAEISPANRRMIRTLGLEIAGLSNYFPVIDVVYSVSDQLPLFRNPELEELRWLYACMRALVQIHPMLKENDKHGVFEDFIQSVDVQWPADDPKAWEIVSVRISYPPKSGQEQVNLPPKLAENSEDYSMDEHVNWIVPRQCAMCLKEVQADMAPRCSRCKAVIYCGHPCQKRHWKDAHRSSCELYRAMMEREEELELKVFVFSCLLEHPCKWLDSVGLHKKGMWRRLCKCHHHCPFGLLPPPEGGGLAGAWGVEHGKYPPDSPLPGYIGRESTSSMVLLSGWAEYYGLRSLPLTSPVAALLTFPLTLYHILTALSISAKNLLAKGREVVVHYLGPEGELDWMSAFSEIGHLLCGSGSLHIVMVGPEVPSSLSGSVSAVGNKMKVTLVQGLYQEEAHYLPSPQVIVALNCGLEAYDSWKGALELIKTLGVTAYFTDDSELPCANAKQILRAAGLQISYPVTPNPFRSPLRNQTPSSNLPSFSNGFVFGVNS